MLTMPASAFNQQTTNNTPPVKTDYLQKSKKQKTAAWVLIGGGLALSTTSILIATPKASEDYLNIFAGLFYADPPPQNSYTAETILLVVGTATMLSSIPLFIASGKNKSKAMSLLTHIKMEKSTLLQQQSFIQTSYPALSVKINL